MGSTRARAALGLALGGWARVALALVASALAGGAGCAAPSDGVADPKSVAIYDVARDEFGRGNLREALSKVDESLDADSNNADAAYLGAIIHLAFCSKDERSSDCRFPEAEHFARKALDAAPDMRDARNVLGVILVHEKRYDDAITVLKPLTEDILYMSPEKSWGNLGWAYLEKGQTTEAIDALLRSVASQPAFCVGNYRLGLAYAKSGDHKAAREAFTRALETDRPGCKTLQDAMLERARSAKRLGDLAGARSDLTKCAAVSNTTEAGERCESELKALGPAPAPPAPPVETPPPAATPSAPTSSAAPATSAPGTSAPAVTAPAPTTTAAPAPSAPPKKPGVAPTAAPKGAGGGH